MCVWFGTPKRPKRAHVSMDFFVSKNKKKVFQRKLKKRRTIKNVREKQDSN